MRHRTRSAGSGSGRRRLTVSAAVAVAGATAVTGCSSAAHPAATPAARAPALGQSAGVFARGQGFGEVKPATIFNGGDPTGLVTGITWKSWGGPTATGTGTTDYVGPSQSVAAGTRETATVVAFRLGTCDGKLMYRAVEWYFPQHGQAFQPRHYQNICAGTYVPGS